MHPEGRHQYNFELPLQHNLPSSFEGECGYVRYLCKATIDKPWKFDHDTKAAFTVISHLDLNREPQELRVGYQDPLDVKSTRHDVLSRLPSIGARDVNHCTGISVGVNYSSTDYSGY